MGREGITKMSKKMKSLAFVFVVVIFASFVCGDITMAGEKPKGQSMSGSATFDYTLSSTATKRDTSSAMWKFTSLADYSTIKGRMYAGFYTMDSAGVDTAKDTIYVYAYSNSNTGWFSDRLVFTDTIVPVDSTYEEISWDLSDSTVYDYIQWKIVTNVNDAAPVGAIWKCKVYIEQYAK